MDVREEVAKLRKKLETLEYQLNSRQAISQAKRKEKEGKIDNLRDQLKN